MIGLSASQIRSEFLAGCDNHTDCVLVVSGRSAPAIEETLKQQLQLRNFELPEIEKMPTIQDKQPGRLPHWQRHDRIPFYATAPRGKRRK
jgi:hypothetical protein